MSTFTEATVDAKDAVGAGPSVATSGLHARLTKAVSSRRRQNGRDSDDDDDNGNGRYESDDELFDELEKELEEEDERGAGIMGRLREERMEALRAQIRQEQAQRNAPRGSGTLTEPTNEKELMQILADQGGELGGGGAGAAGGLPIVVHFYHKEFRRCDIMNTHLELLAAQHPETLFVKMSVLAAPFLVEKLKIKVLPCLVVFGRRAQVKDQVVGFEDLGNSDGFTTHTLRWRLAQGGALREKSANGTSSDQSILGLGSQIGSRADDDDDLDWD